MLLVAPFLAQADATIANVATPAIRAGIGASAAAAQLVIGGYLIAYAVLLITGARLGQTHGYKHLFLIGVAVFGVSSLAGGLAPDAAVLIGMRVAQGGGAALMYPQALTGIQLNFEGDARGPRDRLVRDRAGRRRHDRAARRRSTGLRRHRRRYLAAGVPGQRPGLRRRDGGRAAHPAT